MGFVPVIGSIVAAASLGASVYQAEEAKKGQKASLRQQKSAQAQALARAQSESRRSELERRRLNRKRPDLGTLLTAEMDRARTGPASTLLTSARGAGRPTLGSRSLLGGAA